MHHLATLLLCHHVTTYMDVFLHIAAKSISPKSLARLEKINLRFSEGFFHELED
jgi:hypothetical protein